MPTFSASDLQMIAERILSAIGATDAEAPVVAGHLVTANLTGHDSHGVIRIPQYYAHAKEGRLALRQPVEVERESPTTAVVNGHRTWGQVVATRAACLAIEKAKAHGLAAVAVRNAYHVGRVGAYAHHIASNQLIAKIWCNAHGVARMAPWGGIHPRLGTNPIAIAMPTDAEPILVDITTSVVAEGKVRLAKNQSKPIPDTWVLDCNGAPTTDPAALYNGGSLLPFGGPVGHKGYALAMAVDVLGGVISRDGCGAMAGVPIGNGMLFEALDPTAFLSWDEYLERMHAFLDYVRSARPRPGIAEILLPGEPESRTAQARMREGIAIDSETWRQLGAVASALNVSMETKAS